MIDLTYLKQLEEELRKTPYNKSTQHHIGLIKAKIAKLKGGIERKSKGKGYSGFPGSQYKKRNVGLGR